MGFAERLNDYIDEIGCTAKELARVCGVSEAALSRYRSGERMPAADDDVVRRLAAGIAKLSGREGADLTEEGVLSALTMTIVEQRGDYDSFTANFRLLISALGISGNSLAHALSFDPSYISRIQSGQRRPADLPAFVDGVAEYVARNFARTDNAGLAELCGVQVAASGDESAVFEAVRSYLGSVTPAAGRPPAFEHFLSALDEFDLDTYLKDVRFDDIKVPTSPFQLPTTKMYFGPEGMKQAELDFLRAAVLGRSTDDVILYSDMPMGEMGQDKEFAKGFMVGVAMLVKKGVRLLNIHDTHRPLDELVMGMEGWLPVYMTGQVVPYYLEHRTSAVFAHCLRSAGAVSMTGEAIAGNPNGARFTVSKGAAEVAYVRRRATDLLVHAKPLMRLFFEGEEDALAAAIDAHGAEAREAAHPIGGGTFRNVELSVLPGCYALVTKTNGNKVAFLIEHPALVNAFAQYQPTLY